MNRKTLFIVVAALLVVAFVVAGKLYQQSASVTRNQSIVEREGAPIEGPVDAKVTIVEFFDPACGTCRDFAPRVKQLVKQYPGKVRVMLRYAPLHGGSDQVVKMLEAARYQGKFWQALDRLFRTQNRWVVNHQSQPQLALAVFKSLSLDMDKFMADLDSAKLNQTIQKDIQDGKTLNVRATPEFFVNGKPMPSFGYEQLADLVFEAVGEAY